MVSFLFLFCLLRRWCWVLGATARAREMLVENGQDEERTASERIHRWYRARLLCEHNFSVDRFAGSQSGSNCDGNNRPAITYIHAIASRVRSHDADESPANSLFEAAERTRWCIVINSQLGTALNGRTNDRSPWWMLVGGSSGELSFD